MLQRQGIYINLFEMLWWDLKTAMHKEMSANLYDMTEQVTLAACSFSQDCRECCKYFMLHMTVHVSECHKNPQTIFLYIVCSF